MDHFAAAKLVGVSLAIRTPVASFHKDSLKYHNVAMKVTRIYDAVNIDHLFVRWTFRRSTSIVVIRWLFVRRCFLPQEFFENTNFAMKVYKNL